MCVNAGADGALLLRNGTLTMGKLKSNGRANGFPEKKILISKCDV